MNAPKFLIEENDEFNIIKEILVNDKEPLHFVKTKSYNKSNLELDKNIALKFKYGIINHTDGSYFKLMTTFFLFNNAYACSYLLCV